MRASMLREPPRYVKIEGVTSMPSRGLALAVAVLTFLVFVPVLGGDFLNWDDDRSLLTNEGFRGVGPAQLHWMFTTTLLGHYAPLTWLSFGVTYAIAGMAPAAYHVGSLAIHAFNAVLVYWLAEWLLRLAWSTATPLAIRGGALVAALAFAVHPLRVESVGWITDRGDVLCATFYLLATLAYVRFAVTEPGGARHRWRLASLGAFAAALLSKEIAMTLPLSLLLLDAYPLRRAIRGVRVLLLEKMPWVALAAAGALLAVFARGHGASWTSYAEHGLAARVALAAYSLAFYPLKFVWPSDLSPLYELPARVNPLQARFVIPALAVLAVSAVLVALRRRLPGALIAWLHAAVAVAPVCGLVHAGSQLVADRYSYLPGIGFAVLAGGGITAVVDAWRRGRLNAGAAATVTAVAAIALISLGTLSWQHAWYWRSSVSLWRWAVAEDDACMLCHAKLGAALLAAAAPAEAEPELRHAVALAPDRAGLRVDHGVALALTERAAEAEREFREAIRLAPASLAARLNLMTLYTRTGRPDDALAVLRDAASIKPDDPTLLVSLGRALAEHGQPHDAATALERAVVLAPGLVEARFWLARAYLAAGEAPRAAPHITALEQLDPGRARELRSAAR
jgi:protein O-mannosyl-transferase